MATSRWDPWGDLFGIQRDLSDLFQRTFGETQGPGPAGAGAGGAGAGGAGGGGAGLARRRGMAAFVPPIDVFGREGNLVIRAELPGVKPDDVEVTVHNGILTLRGERRYETKIDEGSYYRMESSYGGFERTIQLPEGTSPDDITANYVDGVLEIVVPRLPQVQPKKVNVAIGQSAGTAGSGVEVTEGSSPQQAGGTGSAAEG